MALDLGKEGSLATAAPLGPQLYRILRHRIISADLTPGTLISESEIARAYDLSRQPVREAFIKLAEDGLVEIRPQRGTLIRKISVDAVMDARFVREAIEADVVKLVAEQADAALVRELRRLLSAQAAVADKTEPAEFMRLDEQFHRLLAEAAGKVYAWKVVEAVKAQMDRVRYLSALRFPKDKLVIQHTAIVDAIAAGDARMAADAMRQHLREVLKDLPVVASQSPDFFDESKGANQGKS